MERMYRQYKDIAQFYIVYIKEAHAADSSWPVPYAKEKGIRQHKTLRQRCEVADRLVKEKKLTIPFLVDDMEDHASQAYQAWPDRIYVIRTDGRLAVVGKPGPWGFVPALQQTEAWLAEYKKAGKEPPLSWRPKGGEPKPSDRKKPSRP